jgi:hypothetical protein
MRYNHFNIIIIQVEGVSVAENLIDKTPPVGSEEVQVNIN